MPQFKLLNIKNVLNC